MTDVWEKGWAEFGDGVDVVRQPGRDSRERWEFDSPSENGLTWIIIQVRATSWSCAESGTMEECSRDIQVAS